MFLPILAMFDNAILRVVRAVALFRSCWRYWLVNSKGVVSSV
jgi:hypothetical protein